MQDEPEITTYAAQINIDLEEYTSVEEWGETIKNFFDKLAAETKIKGAKVIGHIKGFLDLQKAGYSYFSNVGVQETRIVNRMNGDAKNGLLSFNIITYGLEKKIIDEIVNEALSIFKQNFKINHLIIKHK